MNPYLSAIYYFAGNFAIRGFALCWGQIVPIQSNTALFSLLGVTYGGNGTTNFQLPDLRGRAILGTSGTTSGLYPPGLVSGAVAVPLTTSQIPQHNHIIQASTTQGSGSFPIAPTGKIFATATTASEKIFAVPGSAEVQLAPSLNLVNDGNGQPHNNMQPYLAINYMIALQGIFPSRN